MKQKRDKKGPEGFFKSLEYSAVGIEVGLSVAAGALIGYWFDQYFGTDPYGLMFWFLAGCGSALNALIRTVKNLKSDNDESGTPK
ncbi:MAG: AtpZ/AtpI family protein [bacterium]|nr:AtpZ/AtpI family protein [bacterium]